MKVIFSGYKTPVIFWGGINGQEHAGLAILRSQGAVPQCGSYR